MKTAKVRKIKMKVPFIFDADNCQLSCAAVVSRQMFFTGLKSLGFVHFVISFPGNSELEEIESFG